MKKTNLVARLNGQWFVLLAAVLWGTTGTAQAFAPSGAKPVAVGAMRLAIGGGTLLVFALLRGQLRRGLALPIPSTLLAAGSMAAYQLFFFAGVARAGIAIGTVVTIGSSPILAGGMGWLIRGERPDSRWVLATVSAILGAVLLIGTGDRVTVDLAGIGLALGAGASYAVYAIASKDLLEHHLPDTVMAIVFSLGAILLSPVLFVVDLSWLAQPNGMLVTLHLGIVATAMAYTLFARGLKLIPVATAVTLSLAEPLTAATLGIVLLGERPTAVDTAGIGFIFLGLILLTLGNRRVIEPLHS